MAPRLTVRPLLLAMAVAVAACQPTAEQTAAPSPAKSQKTALPDERARVSYMVGLDVARDLQPIKDEIDLAIVQEALRASLAGEPPALDANEVEAVRKQFTAHLREKHAAQQQALAAKNLQAGDAFRADNARKSGVVTTASGLQYQVLKAGSGAKPKAGDTVSVNYLGRPIDGEEFANTWATDHPASFALAQVMPGLSEGLQLMPVGSKYRFWLPPQLAYGEQGRAGEIGPNATLVFEVELLEIAGASP